MTPNLPTQESKRSLCVSVHDVAPHTWSQCERLLTAIRAVADIPVTLLVVPAYHHRQVRDETAYRAALEDRLTRGDELVLHGYTHLDEGTAPDCWANYFTRQVVGGGEAEFYAIGAADARHRIEWGLEWFESRRWPVHGFVAPGWLMNAHAWQALQQFKFKYTTTARRLVALPERKSLFAPNLAYGTHAQWSRDLTCGWNTLRVGMLHDVPLVRFGLHPSDAEHPELIAHFQGLLARLLEQREPMTKITFLRRFWRPEPSPAVQNVTVKDKFITALDRKVIFE